MLLISFSRCLNLSLIGLLTLIVLSAASRLYADPAPTGKSPTMTEELISQFTDDLSKQPSEKLSNEELSNRITKLLSAKRDIARLKLDYLRIFYEQGIDTRRFGEASGVFALRRAQMEYLDAELEVVTESADRIKLLREIADSAEKLNDQVRAMSRAGASGGDQNAVSAARLMRFEAELRLAREIVAHRTVIASPVSPLQCPVRFKRPRHSTCTIRCLDRR